MRTEIKYQINSFDSVTIHREEDGSDWRVSVKRNTVHEDEWKTMHETLCLMFKDLVNFRYVGAETTKVYRPEESNKAINITFTAYVWDELKNDEVIIKTLTSMKLIPLF